MVVFAKHIKVLWLEYGRWFASNDELSQLVQTGACRLLPSWVLKLDFSASLSSKGCLAEGAFLLVRLRRLC